MSNAFPVMTKQDCRCTKCKAILKVSISMSNGSGDIEQQNQIFDKGTEVMNLLKSFHGNNCKVKA